MARRELIMPETGPIMPGILDIAQKREALTNQRIQTVLNTLTLKDYPEERAWTKDLRERKQKEWKLSDILTGEQIGRERILQEEARSRIKQQEFDWNAKISNEIRAIFGRSRNEVEFKRKKDVYVRSLPPDRKKDADDLANAILESAKDDYRGARDVSTGLDDLVRQENARQKAIGEQHRKTDEAEFQRIIGAGGVPYRMKVPGAEKPTGLDWEALTPTAAQAYSNRAEDWFKNEYLPTIEEHWYDPRDWGGKEAKPAPVGRDKQKIKAWYLWDTYGVRNAFGVTDEEIAEVDRSEGGVGAPSPTPTPTPSPTAPPWMGGGAPSPTPTPTPSPTDPRIQRLLDFYDAATPEEWDDYLRRQSPTHQSYLEGKIKEYR